MILITWVFLKITIPISHYRLTEAKFLVNGSQAYAFEVVSSVMLTRAWLGMQGIVGKSLHLSRKDSET